MARARRPSDAAKRRERVRLRGLERVRERAARVAGIVARLPRDLERVPDSEARHELLSAFGLTCAMEADAGRDALELVAETACHAAFWYARGAGQADGWWTHGGEFYQPSADEVLAIAAEELRRARGKGKR